MYTVFNYRTKKALKEAVANGDVEVQRYTNGGFFPESAGSGCIEMPHYPEPHKAYASVQVVDEGGRLLIKKGSKVK